MPASVSSHINCSEGKSVANPPGKACSIDKGIQPIIRKNTFCISTSIKPNHQQPGGRQCHPPGVQINSAQNGAYRDQRKQANQPTLWMAFGHGELERCDFVDLIFC